MRPGAKWNIITAVEERKQRSDIPYILLLLGTSAIWGFAFVAQSVSSRSVPCFTITGIRNLLAGLFLIPFCLVWNRLRPRSGRPAGEGGKTLFAGGAVTGFLLFLAENLQQYGIAFTTTAKAGFITSLYIILVPILGIFVKKKVHPAVWICACIATAGLYLLSVREGFRIGTGDLYVLLCAVGFAVHIHAVSAYACRVDCLWMSCIQFFTASLLSLLCMALFEHPSMNAVLSMWLPIAYAGIISGGIGYSLQIIGQSRIDPARAALLVSPESVFAALAGWLLLGQTLTGRELAGCGLVFAAVILSQLPWEKRSRKQSVPEERTSRT